MGVFVVLSDGTVLRCLRGNDCWYGRRATPKKRGGKHNKEEEDAEDADDAEEAEEAEKEEKRGQLKSKTHQTPKIGQTELSVWFTESRKETQKRQVRTSVG